MFYHELDNSKTGTYIGELIDSRYKSRREFCRKYLELRGIDPNDEEVIKMSNRLSQIIKGAKAIQTYDLPAFTELLGVSCEQILSCGKCVFPTSTHTTNYEVAFSKERDVWEKYVSREDKLILNLDEYRKSVIDYALEFKNYGFMMTDSVLKPSLWQLKRSFSLSDF